MLHRPYTLHHTNRPVAVRSFASTSNRPNQTLGGPASLFPTERLTIKNCGLKHNYVNLHDWYSILPSYIAKTGGGGSLLKRFSGSDVPASFLRLAYPHHNWEVWRFKNWNPDQWWSSTENQRRFLEELEISTNPLTRASIVEAGGTKLLDLYSSFGKALSTLFPEQNKPIWQWKIATQEPLTDDEYKDIFSYLATKLQIEKLEQWYSVTPTDITNCVGEKGASWVRPLRKTLPEVFPNHIWLPWKFAASPVSRHWWEDKANQRLFIQHLMQDLGYSSLEDLYQLSAKNISEAGGQRLLALFKASPFKLLKSVFPDHSWHRWKFTRSPRRWWKQTASQRQFMEYARSQLGCKTLEDFYNITCDDLIKLGGKTLLMIYKMSPSRLLQAVYPEHDWKPWKFDRAPKYFTTDPVLSKQFCEWFEKEHNFTSLDDWYTVRAEELLGSDGVSVRHKTKLLDLLRVAYPSHKWQRWRFQNIRQDPNMGKELIQDIASTLGIRSEADLHNWYSVSPSLLGSTAHARILAAGGLHKLLCNVYPKHKWEEKMYNLSTSKAMQNSALQTLRNVFRCKILNEVRFSDTIVAGQILPIEFDGYMEDFKILLEFQGVQHYFDTFIFGESIKFALHDEQKAVFAANRLMTLVEIPWWYSPESINSLQQTFKTIRPELGLIIGN